MTYNAVALGAKIRRMRIQNSLTQGQFARELGVSQQLLSDWERGKRLRPVMHAMRLALLLCAER